MTIRNWLTNTSYRLKKSNRSPSARLDCEVLLAHVLTVSRSWLIAHGDEILCEKQLIKLEELVRRRLKHEPIAYITGHKEFYSREFAVTPDVLIPRPESEAIIDVLKNLQKITPLREYPFEVSVLDVGTGSGCLAITCKLEMPHLQVTACDISQPALDIAKKNADNLHADVRFVQSDILETFLPGLTSDIHFDIIMANLPYVDETWKRSPETDHEPALALFANDGGIELIKKCIQQAAQFTSVGGYIILEADPMQHPSIASYARQYTFETMEIRDYVVALKKR